MSGGPASGSEGDRPENLPEDRPDQRVVVLLDASPGSIAALQVAAGLARLLGQPLDAIFIEDINLLHLAGLPFCREVGSYTASVRLLESHAIEREYRLLAHQLRMIVQKVAVDAEVEGSFRVIRGGVREAALRESAAASFVALGRVGRFRSPGRAAGSTLQALLAAGGAPLLVGGGAKTAIEPPLVVLFTGSDSSRRALALAIALSERRTPNLPIVVAAEMVRVRSAEHTLQVLLAGREVPYTIASLPDAAKLRDLVRRSPHGALILPADAAIYLSDFDRTLFLVP